MSIEQKALALANSPVSLTLENIETLIEGVRALARSRDRAIEAHEAFRQEVSDACNAVWDLDTFGREQVKKFLSRFIIAKPDPLVDAWQMAFPGNHIEDTRDECAKISAAIEKRGGKIVWGDK